MERELKRVDTIARVRRAFHVQGWSVKKIVRELHVSRNTVRKILRSDETEFSYERERQPLPKTGRWKAEIERFLELVQRLPELTADEVAQLTIVAAPGVLAAAPAPKGLF